MPENPKKNPLSNFNVTDLSLNDVPIEYMDSLLTATQVQRATGLSRSSIAYLRRGGKIPFIRMPNGRNKYPPYVINELLKDAKITIYEPKSIDQDPQTNDLGDVLYA